MEEGVVLLGPAEPREVEHDPRSVLGIRRIPAPPSPPSVGAVEDEMGHLLRMPGGILNCDRTAPAGPHHGKSPEGSGLNHALEIAHPGLEGNILGAPIREPAASGIVAQHLVLSCEGIEPRPPGKALPLMLEMGQPSRRHHQRRTFAAYRIGELHAIRGRAESDALVHGNRRPLGPSILPQRDGGARHYWRAVRPKARSGFDTNAKCPPGPEMSVVGGRPEAPRTSRNRRV